MTASLASTLDLRHIAPSARHAHIFSSFAALLPGQSLQLVNDHDPQPLNEQLQMRSPRSVQLDLSGARPASMAGGNWQKRQGSGTRVVRWLLRWWLRRLNVQQN